MQAPDNNDDDHPDLQTPPRTFLERVARHPLEETSSNASSSVNAASLIQSAARSILDDSSPGTNVSDDEHDDDDDGPPRSAPSKLQSLQSKTLPAFPDEQDRKRFVGCLAAVLARSYSYDCENDDCDYEADHTDGTSQAVRNAEAMAFYDRRSESNTSESFDFPEEASGPSAAVAASSSSSPAGARSSKSDRSRLALRRHRKRRYDVLSKLLVSSADLLMIEKSQAKAFLPMLSKLLVPTSKEQQHQQQQQQQSQKDGTDVIAQQIDDIEFLRPFLESMTRGAGFRCLSLFLLQHLLHAAEGYDARIRHAVKTLGVIVLIHDMERDPVDVFAGRQKRRNSSRASREELMLLATRKFESLEHWIARKLLLLSQEQARRSRGRHGQNNSNQMDDPSSIRGRDRMIRRLKIGGTAVLAGTLFAVSGGLAAPGIAAGVAAIAGGTAATAAAAAVLTSSAAITAIFGVGGGSLAAYKMQRRTQGLTEFSFQKESDSEEEDLQVEAELFSTICVSGWLRDKYDFQRPWGVTPSDPPLTDRRELLERFYAVYKPDHIPKSAQVLEHWEGEEDHLWKLLEQKYGRNPSNLFPLLDGPCSLASVTLEQKEVIDQLFVELGYEEPPSAEPKPSTPLERMRRNWKKREAKNKGEKYSTTGRHVDKKTPDGAHYADELGSVTTVTAASSNALSGFDSVASTVTTAQASQDMSTDSSFPKHVATVWDYKANYGGELYTVKWESRLLTELCDSVADLAFDLVSGGTAQLLKHTALSTLLSAFAWPYALVNAANMIDGTWTLAVERADAAGKELARSLLFSSAGHRPVTLVGYSFGGRAVYSCLKELARYQELWEDKQEQHGGCKQNSTKNSSIEVTKDMREPASIVEDVIIMGLPNHLSISSWKACRLVVSGRLVNCFSQKDLILSLMFQLKRFGGLKSVCGVCAVKVPGVENVDVTDLVSGHQDYCLNTGEILKRVKHGQPFAASSNPSQPAKQKSQAEEGVSKLDI